MNNEQMIRFIVEHSAYSEEELRGKDRFEVKEIYAEVKDDNELTSDEQEGMEEIVEHWNNQ